MLKNNDGQVRAGWLIAIALVAMFIGQTIFALPGTILLGIMDAMNNPDTLSLDIMVLSDEYPWVFLLMQGGGTVGGLIVTLILWRYMNKKSMGELGFRGSLTDLVYGLLLGAGSIAVIFILLLVSGNVEVVNAFSEPMFSTYTITFLIIFILVGFFEEIFFRGYVMTTMANRGNKKWLIYLVSAIIFSLVHGANPNVSIPGLINILLVGLLFAYMFDATKSLWMPIGYHITWNYFQGNVFGFAVSGTTPHGIYQVDISKGNDLLTGGTFGLEGGILATLMILVGFVLTNVYAKRKVQQPL